MDGNVIAFYILAIVAIASALGMLFSQNAIYSALFLIMNFATVAIFYLILGAPFIAMAQVTVYAGAIMVLFLFVIMLLGVEKLTGESKLVWQRPLAWILGFILVIDAVFLLGFQGNTGANIQSFPDGFGVPQAIGEILFNEYLLPFEVTSVLLLVAMIGAIVLSKTNKEKTNK